MPPPKDPIRYAEWIEKIKNRVISPETRKKQSDAKRNNIEYMLHMKEVGKLNKGRKPTDAARAKMSASSKGHPKTEEHKKHISEGQKNKVVGERVIEHLRNLAKLQRGVPLTKEHKQKLCGHPKPKSAETRAKMSAYQKGRPKTEEHKQKLRKPKTEEHKQKLRKPKTYEHRKKASITKQGVSEEEWSGFASAGVYCGKWTDPIYKVRKRVRARFNDRCIICGKNREQNSNKRMSVHHVYRKKDACCDGEKSDWLFATLCTLCHSTYGHNDNGTQLIKEILSLEYGNKCMLSLTEYNELYPNNSDGDKRWGYANGR